MARRGGASTQRQAPQAVSNGHPNGLPPPSTIPAQIVHNAANASTQHHASAKQPFIDQVKDFLRHPELNDPDPLCSAFVCAITNGGLDPFFQEDPFALNRLEVQAIHCIAALKVIFDQKPYLLLAPTHAEEHDGASRPPVIIWLLPKLLGLLAQDDSIKIHDHVQDLLATFLNVFSRSARALRQTKSIMQLYRSCAEKILLALKSFEEVLERPLLSFNVPLPCSNSITEFWPDIQHSVVLPQGLQRAITSPTHAIYIGFHLLQILLQFILESKQSITTFGAYEYLRPWVLRSCTTLWQSLRDWSFTTDTIIVQDQIVSMYMTQLESIAFPKASIEDEFLCSQKAAISFTSGFVDMIQTCMLSPFSEPNQRQLASLMARFRGALEQFPEFDDSSKRHRRDLKQTVMDSMEPVIAGFFQELPKLISLHKDLQFALCLWTSPGDWPTEVQNLRTSLCSDSSQSFSSEELNQDSFSFTRTFRRMNLAYEERPSKRRRTLPEPLGDEKFSTYNWLIMALNGSSPESPVFHLSNLHSIIQERYSNMSKNPQQCEQEQCELLLAFGKIACAGSQCMQSPSNNQRDWKNSICTVCDATSFSPQEERRWDSDTSSGTWKDVVTALITMTQETNFQSSSKPQILMAVVIGRVFNHISDSDYLNLQMCSLGQWLLKSMTRSSRELRIAASRSLMSFLREDIPNFVRDKNRQEAMQFFAELTKRNVPSVQETLIMAYGQAARMCSEVELHIILCQLVEYLGHPNTVIYGAAYNELLSLADDFGTSPVEMLRPYWRTIGFSIMNEFHNKPQKAEFVGDLTRLSPKHHLLLEIHGDVLPVLVLNKRKDILQSIAQARRTSIEDVCLQPRHHLARILALLLCQTGEGVERRAMDTLIAVAPGFQQSGQGLHQLVQLEPASAACEVLKLAADRNERDKESFHEGFYRIAALDDVKDNTRKPVSKRKSNQLESFVSKHILGVMAHFSDVVENLLGAHPLSERKRCVGAIREMILLAGADASYALSQLRACLQSAMADPHLCDQAFDAWSVLLEVLDQENLKLVVDQTFALAVHTWPSFSDDTRLKASKAIETLRQHHNALLQERICYIPTLASIPMMSKLEGEIARLKAKKDPVTLFSIFCERCNEENALLVRPALKELIPFLEQNQKILHQSAISQKPLPALTELSRSLLDICVRFADNHGDIPSLCAQCLGLIGGLDPYRVETVREKKQILVLSNFQSVVEVIKFAAFMLEEVLVKVFLSTTNAKSQGYLAYLIQELCKACGFGNEVAATKRSASQSSPAVQRWNEMPPPVRTTLSPFLNSRYIIRSNVIAQAAKYPIFHHGISNAAWLRQFTFDLLHKAKEHNAESLFSIVARVIRHQDLSIAVFILPFAVVSAIIDGEEDDFNNISQELLTILETGLQRADPVEATHIKQCSENVFQILDYLALWLQEKRKATSEARQMAGKTGRGISEEVELETMKNISAIERLLQLIPPKVISQRAVECGSYARALFHWEQYYREEQAKSEAKQGHFAKDDLLQHLQFIYAQIDEPDSVEGISAHLQVLNPEQQIMEHRKAGRWTAAQSWYELALAERPTDPDTQVDLLTCLRESGQYDAILNYVDGFNASNSISLRILPFAAEAAWSTCKWGQLEKTLTIPPEQLTRTSLDFNVGIGKALLALRHKNEGNFKQIIDDLRGTLAKEFSPTTTASLHASHDCLVKLHTLYELEAISGMSTYTASNREIILENLDRRLDLLGVYTSDKQYLLGVRRAAMQMSSIGFTNLDIASAWLTTARLARKGDFTPAAFNSILHASQLGDDASKIEYSKMLWKQGHHRKAIQNLQGAITSSSFQTRDMVPMEVSVSVSTTNTTDGHQSPNKVRAHAELLLAKWLDRAGQTPGSVLKEDYGNGVRRFPKWDKGHYYLGRYYLKLYETEKALPVAKQAANFQAGELTKLVIENYTRSTVYGSKYYYQTIPKILTLWLDMGMEVMNTQPRLPKDKDIFQHKLNHLDIINKYIKRYSNERMPVYPWYTAFPQIITRISHPNKSVWEVLQLIILKVAGQYPQQALWSLLAVLHSTQNERRTRGTTILQKLRDHGKKKSGALDLKNLILHGQRLTDSLLAACDAPIEQRVSHVSLTRDLGFNIKLAPCALVVPIEATMIPTLPSSNDSRVIRAHNPFPQDTITISEFQDDVLVLSSLQRPRKVTVIGSDGRQYGLLCKPKDDLRKDQRLMEFNAMINRALTRDIESSKRRLYIKTYGVTPLNEECGTIEWVEGLKPMRDIIIRLYRQKNINIDYADIRTLLNEACSDPSKLPIFTDKILKKFQPVLHEWFVESFPEPEAWFAARLRYTRSCAVMSIVGHVLGLGDRHGENVLLEQGNGGTFHVDFNCLFDKGLTFEKPELVPFRLTHNMVDAMGPSGVEGPFRKTAELTYSLLRQHQDTLITILETFVHDPTADFLGGRKKKRVVGVAETPQEVLEIVGGKLGGFIRGESVPLSVEGYVDSLVRQARDPRNLAAMYIGWCAFF